MKILHTADLHLKTLKDERWEALSAVVEIGRKEKIDAMVIAGDLFDSARSADDLYPKLREVFKGGGFPVLVLPGNHDHDSYPGGIFLGEGVTVLSSLKDPVEVGCVLFWGLPFVPRERTGVLALLHSVREQLTGDTTNVLVYHGELTDKIFDRSDLGEEGDERYMPARLSHFADLNFDYVLAGHFHTSFDIFRFGGDGYFVYPGSPVSVTRRETGRRAVNLFEIGGPPAQLPLDTAHFVADEIACDPFSDENPAEVIKRRLADLHPRASALVAVTGFIDGTRLGLTETTLRDTIVPLLSGKGTLDRYEVRDIGAILADDLFGAFEQKLAAGGLPDEQKGRVRELVIRAMMEAAR